MASLFVDVHLSKAKLTLIHDGNDFLIASMITVYSFQQIWLRVAVDGSTRSLYNALYDYCRSRFDIALHLI